MKRTSAIIGVVILSILALAMVVTAFPIDDYKAEVASSKHYANGMTGCGLPGGYSCHGEKRAYGSTEEWCESCHGEKDFQGFGKIMDKKGVECVDCHMPYVPNTHEEGEHRLHSFTMPGGDISCGIGDENCHLNKDSDWAQKQIDKNKMHGKK